MTFVRSTGQGIPGLPGQIFKNLVLYVDGADPNCYGGTGSNVNDIEGNATNGLLAGTVTFADGAFRFTRTVGDELRFTKNGDLANIFSGGGTVVVFARCLDLVSTQVLATTQATGDNLGWRLRLRDGDTDERYGVEFEQTFTGNDGIWRTYDQTSITDPEPLTAFSGVRPLSIGAMSAVAVVYDSSDVANDPTIYINGQDWTVTKGLQETGTPTLSADDDTANDLLIGFDEDDTEIFDGDIATVLMFDRALTSTEVAQVSNAFATRYGLGAIGRPVEQTETWGQNILIRGGANENGSSSTDTSGSVSILGGDLGAGTNSSRAGSVLVRGGHSFGFGNGGDVDVEAGRIDNSSSGGGAGDTTVAGGQSNYTQQGGELLLKAGDNDNTATSIGASGGGHTLVRAGDSLSTGNRNSSGGHLSLRGGGYRTAVGGGSSQAGNLYLRSGGATIAGAGASTTGDIYLYTDSNAATLDPQSTTWAGTTVNTGDITISTESQATDANSTGSISLTCGDTTTITGSIPGAVSITAGSQTHTTNSSNAAADITVTAGSNAGDGASATRGGDVTVTAGVQSNGLSTSRGGNITLSVGTSVGGSDGQIIMNGEVVNNGPVQTASISTQNGTASSGDPLDITLGTADTGFDGADATIFVGRPAAGQTAGAFNVDLHPGGVGTAGRLQIQDSATTRSYFDITTANTTQIVGADAATASSPGEGIIIKGGAGGATSGDSGDVTLSTQVAPGAGNDGEVILITDRVVPTPNAAVEFAIVLPLPASGDGNDFRLTAAAGFTSGDSGGDLILQAAASGGGAGSDGTILINSSGGTNSATITPTDALVTINTLNGPSPGDVGIDILWITGGGNTSGDGGTQTLRMGAGGSTTGNSGDLVFDWLDPAGSGTKGRLLWQWNTVTESTTSHDSAAGVVIHAFADAHTTTSDGNSVRVDLGAGGSTSGDAGDFILRQGGVTSGLASRWVMEDSSGNETNGIWFDSAELVIIHSTPDAAATSTANSIRLAPGDGGATSGDAGDVVVRLATTAGSGSEGGFVVENNGGTRQNRIEFAAANIATTMSAGPSSGDAGTGFTSVAGAGNGAASGGGYSWLTGSSGTGATGDSGAITLETDDASSTNGSTGDITLETGTRTGTGTNGRIINVTKGFSSLGDTSGSVQFRTQSDFTSTSVNKFTSGSQDTVSLGGTVDVATVATLGTDGRNIKIDLWAVVQDNASASNVSSARIEQMAYRSGGTVSLAPVHRNDKQGNGTMNTDLSFSLVVSSNDVLLRVTNGSSVTAYTFNTSISVETQQGGASS